MKIGELTFDTIEYASRANTIVGIRDSGKSYTATMLGEQLIDAGIPIVAFDPAGIWRFLRVPGKGKGYPVVVVGGEGADIPLKPETIGKVVLSALQGGVSLVIDFTGVPSKSDMRGIVRGTVDTLMKNNKKYGLRHILIEEAAEFVPQKVRDGLVYEAVERLVRIGGNMGLGVTMINPRTQNLNKEVLELCENIILHRQLGKNSLENLHGWFEARGLEEPKSLSQSVSGLKSGEAVVWLSTSTEPVQVKVQEKNSLHPNRRDTKATAAALLKQVDAGQFIKGMLETLPAVEAEIKANDPTELKKQLAEARAAIKKLESVKPATAPALSKGDEIRIRSEGYNAGWAAAMKENEKQRVSRNKAISAVQSMLEKAMATLPPVEISVSKDMRATVCPPTALAKPETARALTALANAAVNHVNGGLPRPQQRVLDAVAWWKSAGHEAPTRAQVAGVAGYSPGSGGFNNLVGGLNTAGLLTVPAPGALALTDEGEQKATPQDAPNTEELHRRVRAVLNNPQIKLIDALIANFPDDMTREDLAEATGYSAGSGGFNNLVGSLSTLQMITKPSPGRVKAADWLFLEH